MSRNIKKSTILIVDDSPTNIKVLGESLKSKYKIRLATSGKKALELVHAGEPPDLILLDIIMPAMDGYEVCQQLKADIKTKNIPIIFITAKDEEEDETRGLSLGAVDYITKPFSLAIVLARLKTHLELKQHRDLLENLSSRDGLTGIPNRRKFDEVIDSEWARARREKHSLSLVLLDIDYFKLYNDNYGHVAGDDCLKKVASLLENLINRATDFVARYGGEEFVILLPATGYEGANKIATSFNQTLENSNILHEYSPVDKLLTCSMGIATVTPCGDMSIIELIEEADKQLYLAKDLGRNTIRGIDLSKDNGWQSAPSGTSSSNEHF